MERLEKHKSSSRLGWISEVYKYATSSSILPFYSFWRSPSLHSGLSVYLSTSLSSLPLVYWKILDTSIMSTSPAQASNPTTYQASCHCGSTAYTVALPLPLPPPTSTETSTSPSGAEGETEKTTEIASCNCSICTRNGYLLVYVPKGDVKFSSGGWDELGGYRFGSVSFFVFLLPFSFPGSWRLVGWLLLFGSLLSWISCVLLSWLAGWCGVEVLYHSFMKYCSASCTTGSRYRLSHPERREEKGRRESEARSSGEEKSRRGEVKCSSTERRGN